MSKKKKEEKKEEQPQEGVKQEEVKQEEKREPKAITVLDVDYERLEFEAADYKDKYLRILAESENARRRMQKERQEMMKFAIQDIIIDFLRPLDQFETALNFAEQMSDEVKNWAIGFEMILKQFKDVFVSHGVTSYSVKEGVHFDPHYHEAVELVETDEHEPGTVIKEILKGYSIGDRTIRPAHVKVAKVVDKKSEEDEKK